MRKFAYITPKEASRNTSICGRGTTDFIVYAYDIEPLRAPLWLLPPFEAVDPQDARLSSPRCPLVDCFPGARLSGVSRQTRSTRFGTQIGEFACESSRGGSGESKEKVDRILRSSMDLTCRRDEARQPPAFGRTPSRTQESAADSCESRKAEVSNPARSAQIRGAGFG